MSQHELPTAFMIIYSRSFNSPTISIAVRNKKIRIYL